MLCHFQIPNLSKNHSNGIGVLRNEVERLPNRVKKSLMVVVIISNFPRFLEIGNIEGLRWLAK